MQGREIKLEGSPVLRFVHPYITPLLYEQDTEMTEAESVIADWYDEIVKERKTEHILSIHMQESWKYMAQFTVTDPHFRIKHPGERIPV